MHQSKCPKALCTTHAVLITHMQHLAIRMHTITHNSPTMWAAPHEVPHILWHQPGRLD